MNIAQENALPEDQSEQGAVVCLSSAPTREGRHLQPNQKQAALDYAAKGTPVFPCRADKRPYTAHGFKEATTDHAQIEAWWQKRPDAMIGMPTGAASGVVVLDVDIKPGRDGDDTLFRLERANTKLPDTVEVLTPSGGRHLYFEAPTERVKSTNDVLGPGLDVRGDGGYVVVPPSRKNGCAYEWEGSNPERPAPMPTWLINLMKAPSDQKKASPTDGDIPAGTRNETLFKLACSLRGKGLTEASIRATLQEENAGRCHPPLPSSEVQRIAKSAGEYPVPEPGAPGDLEAAAKTVSRALAATKADPGAIYAREVLSALLEIRAGDIEEYGRIRAELRLLKVVTDVEKRLTAFAQEQSRARFEARRTPRTFIMTGGDLHLAVRHADTLLTGDTRPVRFYQRGGLLVRVTRTKGGADHGIHRQPGALSILPVESAALTCRLTELGEWCVGQEGSEGPPPKVIDCPPKIAEGYLAGGTEWSVPPLAGTIEAPTLRPDGTVLATPGYDQGTGLLFDPGPVSFHAIPDRPTKDQALASVEQLCKPINDFPFTGPESKAVAVAAILTALVRRSMSSAPMFAFSAPKMGSGKSLLADVVSMILTGRRCAVMTHETNPEEERKRLLAVLLEGDPVVCMDNISKPVDSDALCSVLTQPIYKARILGQSRNIAAPTTATWLATGNNLTISGDLSTRVLTCTIDSATERPEERVFKRNLCEWIPTNRSHLVAAGLTMLRAWYVAGGPRAAVPPYGRFETWEPIRHALLWLGFADPCATRHHAEAGDPVREQLREVLELWYATFGQNAKTVREVIEEAGIWLDGAGKYQHPELREVLVDVGSNRKGTLSSQSVGWYLRRHAGRIEGGFRLERAGDYGKGRALWKVIKCG